MHFTMKFETMKHGKNAVEIFVKWGLSWHGALAFYSVQSYVEPYVYDKRKETMYIYHINTLDNKQDSSCVSYLIEAILNCTKSILPDINRVILHSENVISYQNSIVTFFIHTLRISIGIFVSHFIHTDTGSGKNIDLWWIHDNYYICTCLRWCRLQCMNSDVAGVRTELQHQ